MDDRQVKQKAVQLAAILSAVLTTYFLVAALVLNGGATTPADDAATHVIGVLAGGFAVLTACLLLEVFSAKFPIARPQFQRDDEQP